MPQFRYRALTERGELVSGVISAPNVTEVARRIDYLRLVPIDSITEEKPGGAPWWNLEFRHRARSEDVTIFTLDLALLLQAGAHLDDALDLLATDVDIGRLRSTAAAIRSSVLAGENFADALAQHPEIFPAMYVALVRVGEATGTLGKILQALARERGRAEALRRKLTDALRYPAFVLLAAISVLIFFLLFVLPQFGAVLRDFGAKIDPIAEVFIQLSDALSAHKESAAFGAVVALTFGLLAWRQPRWRSSMLSRLGRLPLARTLLAFHRTALFCRNLEVLLTAAVPLTRSLRILADMMATLGEADVWGRVVERVRHGGKLSEALAEAAMMPAMAVRMLRLGDETGELPVLAGRVADFYETKLQRSLDRIVGVIGPLAIISISVVVGGLIVSIMTSLLSVSQLVG
jgi:general secretion pathway protein F